MKSEITEKESAKLSSFSRLRNSLIPDFWKYHPEYIALANMIDSPKMSKVIATRTLNLVSCLWVKTTFEYFLWRQFISKRKINQTSLAGISHGLSWVFVALRYYLVRNWITHIDDLDLDDLFLYLGSRLGYWLTLYASLKEEFLTDYWVPKAQVLKRYLTYLSTWRKRDLSLGQMTQHRIRKFHHELRKIVF